MHIVLRFLSVKNGLCFRIPADENPFTLRAGAKHGPPEEAHLHGNSYELIGSSGSAFPLYYTHLSKIYKTMCKIFTFYTFCELSLLYMIVQLLYTLFI
jgi:hypothetical protein